MELVDGINVMFGNPNSADVESQPYILVIGRDTVASLKWEAERYSKNKDKYGKGGTASDSSDIESIQYDADTTFQAGVGGKTELIASDDRSGKALYVYLYTKVTTEKDVIDEETGLPVMEDVLDKNGKPVQEKDKNGKPVVSPDGSPVYKRKPMRRLVTTVHVTKATKNVNIFEDVDTGLTRYPIAWGNWEKQKNQYHGRALVTGIVPKLNNEVIESIMSEEKPNQREKINIKYAEARRFIPASVPYEKTGEYILKALEYYHRYQERQKSRNDAR